MKLKAKLYDLIVNSDPAVKVKYEKYVTSHPDSHADHRLRSWLYLLRLRLNIAPGEKDHLRPLLCETEKKTARTAGSIAEELCASEAVSFDVFDTLIFRPLSSPKDVFFFVGEKLGHPDYRSIRAEAERLARKRKEYSSEVTADEIFSCLEELTGIPAAESMAAELETEAELCFGNPFMLDVWNRVKAKGKRIVITTDMYLPSEFIGRLLDKNGFTGYERIFVSCEHGCGKYNGGLFEKVKEYLCGASCSHIGDNIASDVNSARKHGFFSVHYPNVNILGNEHRCNDMSSITGSAYSGIVNAHLYCSDKKYSPFYEYGYKVGGIAVLGYCSFIHKTALRKKADKVLFFSRDGYILKKVYDDLFPDSVTEYVYWSRAAAAKLGAYRFRYDYFRRFVYHKRSSGMTAGQLLEAMELGGIKTELGNDTVITAGNAPALVHELTTRYDEIISHYESMDRAARKVFEEMLSGCKNVLTVDCGWAGSGHIILDTLVNDKWGMNCEMTGILAGTNSVSQSNSDFSDTYLRTGKLIPYCYSNDLNRHYYKNHFPAADHNVYFEMLFGAPHSSFLGYSENGLLFDSGSENEDMVNEIHRGELDFVSEYMLRFGKYDYMKDIAGSDAYAPFAFTVIGNEKAVKKAFSEFVFDRDVSGVKEKLSGR